MGLGKLSDSVVTLFSLESEEVVLLVLTGSPCFSLRIRTSSTTNRRTKKTNITNAATIVTEAIKGSETKFCCCSVRQSPRGEEKGREGGGEIAREWSRGVKGQMHNTRKQLHPTCTKQPQE